MTEQDLHHWDEKHRAQSDRDDAPASFLVEQITRVGGRGKALDVASGQGRNSLFLARLGFEVEAIDIAPSAVSRVNQRAQRHGLAVRAIQQDLDTVALGENRYDLIVDFNYLNRRLIPELKAALRPAGFVIFETFLVEQKEIGHPKNPAYLLRPNELLELFRDFRVLFYREGLFPEQGTNRFVASLLAQKWADPWRNQP